MTTLPPCGQTTDDTSPLDHSEEGRGSRREREGGRGEGTEEGERGRGGEREGGREEEEKEQRRGGEGGGEREGKQTSVEKW